jgi:hypothetical protein
LDNGLFFTYTSTEGGLSYSTPTGESYAAKFDGQDYPYKGNPGVTSVVIKRIDDRTIEETGKRDGRVRHGDDSVERWSVHEHCH